MKFYKNLFLLTLCFVLLCLLNILFNKQVTIISTEEPLIRYLRQLLRNNGNVEPFTEHDVVLNAIILQQTLMNSFESGNYDDVNLLPLPMQNRTTTVVFSSWRTGSTFLGDIINVVPGTYYHYEPFNYRSVEQQETTVKNVEHVLKLIKCQFDTESVMQHIEIDAHWHYNKRLYGYCNSTLECNLCKQGKFREKFCNIFPKQIMKLVRARISMADSLLNDTDVNVKVILQIRDPRAVFLSRKTLEGCNFHPHCNKIEHYCNFLVDDYRDVQILINKYPNRIMTLKYEDLASHPFKTTENLFTFLQLPFTQVVIDFLKSHTISDQGDIYSTFRDSKTAAIHWIRDLNISEVEYVQTYCKEAMDLWGYKLMQTDRKS